MLVQLRTRNSKTAFATLWFQSISFRFQLVTGHHGRCLTIHELYQEILQMIRFNGGYREDRDATMVGLGLSEGNLIRFQRREPVEFTGDDLQLTNVGFAIIYGNNQAEFKSNLQTFLNARGVKQEGILRVINMQNRFLLVPMVLTERAFYIIGLTNTSLKLLRRHEELVFRSRIVEGNSSSVEICLFYGLTEEILEEELVAQGIINQHAKVIRN